MVGEDMSSQEREREVLPGAHRAQTNCTVSSKEHNTGCLQPTSPMLTQLVHLMPEWGTVSEEFSKRGL